jgi:hypothetical protein
MPETTVKTEAPRYAPGTQELCARVLATRERIGRPAMAAWLGISQSACYRWERDMVHPGAELKALKAVDWTKVPTAGKPVSRATRLETARQLVHARWSDLPEDFRQELTNLLAD